MSGHEILLAVMGAFAGLGALDRILGNRLGLGAEFEKGILAMGELALAMLGILCLAPALARLLEPAVVPVFTFLGADPGMFPGTLLACDMGAGPLALEMAGSREAGLLGGILTGSMLGATVVFTIPAALGILEPEDRPALAKGVLCGVVTTPLGILAGGLTAGFAPGLILRNLTPIVLVAGLIALGQWKAEGAMIRGFGVFGRVVTGVITLGLGAAILESLTGWTLIPGMEPLEVGFETVGAIAAVLAGAFPLVYTVTRLLRRPLEKLGRLLGINDAAAGGLVATLANSIATFGMVRHMDRRGKVVNLAFGVSGAFVFGDHLGFTAGFAPEMLPAMILGKLAGGFSAVALALLLTRKEKKR